MITLTPGHATLADWRAVADGAGVRLDPAALPAVEASARTVDAIVARGAPVYGINTGFGKLASVHIGAEDLVTLQRNIVLSHAAGVGEPMQAANVRLMMALKLASLGHGASGVRPQTIAMLEAMLERGITPIIPSQGSVGTSGDLAPLAHLALVLIGEGEAFFEGHRMPGADALRRAGLEPVELAEKEGLALINGTHLMAAAGGLAIIEARRVLEVAIVASALSLEAFMGSTAPFDDRIHALRPQRGQRRVATRLRALLAGSSIVESHADCGRVQDPYTLRCIPQVLGAISDALDYVTTTLELELTAVTDNPLVFPDEGDVVSGGNFHGQPLSLVLDHLALALCELASFSERRTYALLSPSYAGLPPFLTPHPGLNSGLMIVQYAQAALVSECMVLAHPAGAGSIPTSAGQEDFNSMGALAALKARTVIENASHVVASELACACQGLEFHRPLRTTEPLEGMLAAVRERIPRIEHDRSLAGELATLARDIRLGELALP
jgi:histidine ammonia-lyase